MLMATCPPDSSSFRLLTPTRRLLRNNLIHLSGEDLEPAPQQLVLNRQLAHLVSLFDFFLVVGLVMPRLLGLLQFPESLVCRSGIRCMLRIACQAG